MEAQNEKGGSTGSGRTTRQQNEGITGDKGRSGNRGNETGNSLNDIGVNKNQFLTALGVVAGGVLLYKGAKALTGSGRTGINKKAIVEIKSNLVIKRPKEELYAYWRNLENLPNFMSHIEEINQVNDKRSHWVAAVPGGLGHIEWEAEIIWEQENQLIVWRSLPDSEIENSGEVRFQDSGNRKSTIVETTISYRPPAGKAGGLAAKLLNPAFKKIVESDLKEFKKVMEMGGISRRKGSPASRM
ncbi:SRPBCC family protein [Gillisia limnaea]|uniref:Cyclase/dehydrase n=1 Tax=Gillisia limnaea (strain DSM 15749 / LMG 21470 / R-8282) TaxID=865937 RepID=H2BVZ0_GILLR|nr:SRPBCC family protein [Gillisia limnaea]EHQ01873.1 cyclase/dehydrase [Gillisia limnaea DSM 15749]